MNIALCIERADDLFLFLSFFLFFEDNIAREQRYDSNTRKLRPQPRWLASKSLISELYQVAAIYVNLRACDLLSLHKYVRNLLKFRRNRLLRAAGSRYIEAWNLAFLDN